MGQAAVTKSRQDEELVAEMDVLQEGICRRQRAMLQKIATFDANKSWEIDGCHSMCNWLTRRYGYSSYEARLWVKAAHAIKKLPRIAAALEKGELGISKVLQLTRYATPESEADLIKWAKRVTVGTIRERVDEARRIEIDEVRSAEERLSLSWQPSEDRLSLQYWGEMPAGDGVAFIKAISRRIDQMGEASVVDESLTPKERFERKCGNALIEMAMNEIATDADTDRATVVVYSDMSTPEHNSQVDGLTLHPEIVKRLRCDGRIESVITDKGKTIGIGRASREIPAWLHRQLAKRDHHRCRFPGCDRKAFLQGHHIWDWELGGPTNLDNLVLVCHHHHKLLHEGGWRVDLEEDSTARWWDPRGSPVA